jgi:hypothetical protein
LSAGRFKRLLGLDSSPRTVAALLPRYAGLWVSRHVDVRPDWAVRQALAVAAAAARAVTTVHSFGNVTSVCRGAGADPGG